MAVISPATQPIRAGNRNDALHVETGMRNILDMLHAPGIQGTNKDQDSDRLETRFFWFTAMQRAQNSTFSQDMHDTANTRATSPQKKTKPAAKTLTIHGGKLASCQQQTRASGSGFVTV